MSAAPSEPLMTLTQVAEHLTCSTRKVSDLARELGVGINLGSRAGCRFTDADLQKMLDALRVKPEPDVIRLRRRRRREQRARGAS